MFCWKECELTASEYPDLEEMDGAPMSVQQAFAEMIGKEDLTLERYQVRVASIASGCRANWNSAGVCISQATRLCRHTNRTSIIRISCCSSFQRVSSTAQQSLGTMFYRVAFSLPELIDHAGEARLVEPHIFKPLAPS